LARIFTKVEQRDLADRKSFYWSRISLPFANSFRRCFAKMDIACWRLHKQLISERFEGFFSTTKNQQVTASLVSGFLEQGVGFLGNVGIEAGMEAGLLDRVWSLEELVGLLEQKVVGLAAA
jgi:hypothetical protein